MWGIQNEIVFIRRRKHWKNIRSGGDIAKYEDVYFVDKNEELIGKSVSGYQVRDTEEISDDTAIIITSIYWKEIYSRCCLNNFRVIGIYDSETDQVYTYKEMCRLRKCVYKNEKFVKYEKQKNKRVSSKIENFLCTDNLYENISEVAIMLSNLCNYAAIHKLCPAGCVEEKKIMPSRVVYKILDELGAAKFDGTICFHIYNEPLIDPRLFLFIQYAKQHIEGCKILIYSNGWYLNDQMVTELQDIGADILVVTGYGEKEYNRLIELPVQIPYTVLFGNLDHRLDIYKDRQNAVSDAPCRFFFSQVTIYVNGDIGVCCLDHRHSYGLGNICNMSLKDFLDSEKMVNIQKQLLSGNREIFSCCKNCNWK